MRKNRAGIKKKEESGFQNIRILALDDDEMMTLTLQTYFRTSGYEVETETNPQRAIDRLKNEHFDILMLDFLMTPICGDEVVSRIRTFNKKLFIILLTGHKSLAPPIKTIRELEIQGYYEKSERFDQLELLVESCVKSIKLMRTIGSYKDSLKSILDANPEIYKLQKIDDLADTLIKQAGKIFGESDRFVYIIRTFEEPAFNKSSIRKPLGKDLFFGIGKYSDRAEYIKEYIKRLQNGEQIASIISDSELDFFSPLRNEKNEIIGAFGAERTGGAAPADFSLYKLFVRQLSAAVSNALLHLEVSVKNEALNEANESLNENYYDMISAVRYMVDARDIYTRGHSDRVSHYSVLIADELGKDEAFKERVRVAGLFHDIGKISIPDCILLKNSTLSDEEFNRVKTHALNGFNILSVITVFKNIADIVVQHHERVDGSGYPLGLTGSEISEEGKIICVADAFDAMVSDRQYRKGMDAEAAVEEMEKCRGTQFDPDIVDAFLRVLDNYDEIEKDLKWTHSRTVISPDSKKMKGIA